MIQEKSKYVKHLQFDNPNIEVSLSKMFNLVAVLQNVQEILFEQEKKQKQLTLDR